MTNNALFTYDPSTALAEQGGPNRPIPCPGSARGELPWVPGPAAIQVSQRRLEASRQARDEITNRVPDCMSEEAPQ